MEIHPLLGNFRASRSVILILHNKKVIRVNPVVMIHIRGTRVSGAVCSVILNLQEKKISRTNFKAVVYVSVAFARVSSAVCVIVFLIHLANLSRIAVNIIRALSLHAHAHHYSENLSHACAQRKAVRDI
jgi:hypothetical protein